MPEINPQNFLFVTFGLVNLQLFKLRFVLLQFNDPLFCLVRQNRCLRLLLILN